MDQFSTRRLIIYCLGALLLVFATLLWLRIHDDARLESAISQLLAGNYSDAERAFSEVRGSLFIDNEAELGEALSSVLSGTAESKLVFISRRADSRRFKLETLMGQLLRHGDFVALEKICDIGQDYKLPVADYYKAVALLELGKLEKARALLSSFEDRVSHPLMQRFEMVWSFMEQHAVTRLIYDRDGRLLAGLTADKSFVWTDDLHEAIVQPLIREAILRSPGDVSLRLTLDVELSRAALAILSGKRGSIVLLAPGANQVLVAVSDRQTSEEMGQAASPVFQQQLEPASISKLITTVAAMRSGIDPDERLSGLDSSRAIRYDDDILWNPANLGTIDDLDEAMAGSCNISFAELGIDAGWEQMVAELQNFGFDGYSGNPFELGHILKNNGNSRELADLAIGLEHTRTTPFHCALIASVFANSGTWQEPQFILAEDGLLGMSPQKLTGTAAARAVFPEAWLDTIRDSMVAVTQWGGTARGISPRGYPVAMKTGTGGGEWEFGFHVNYIGFAPVNTPDVIFAVRITNERRSDMARRLGYGATKELLTYLRDNKGQLH